MAVSGTCGAKLTQPKYGINKQNKDREIQVFVSEDVNYLKEISTNERTKQVIKGTEMFFNETAIPKDLIDCRSNKCHMTGGLVVTPVEGEIKLKYQVKGDFTKAVFGYDFLYLGYTGTSKVDVISKISDYEDYEQANSYSYKDTVQSKTGIPTDYTIAQHGFGDANSVVEQTGTGWTPSHRGITIEYTISFQQPNEPEASKPVFLSSIKFVCSKTELHKADVVMLSCLDSFSFDQSVDATDARCLNVGYDKDSATVEAEITAVKRTPNDYWLNPFESRGIKTVTGVPVTKKFTVEEKDVNGVKFGYIELSDLYANCNSVYISLGDECLNYHFDPVQAPKLTSLDTQETLTIYNPNDEFGATYFHRDHIGQEVLVTYDTEEEATVITGGDSKMNSFLARFRMPIENFSNNKDSYYEFYGIITSVNQEFNNTDEVSLVISVTLKRDGEGNFYKRIIVE